MKGPCCAGGRSLGTPGSIGIGIGFAIPIATAHSIAWTLVANASTTG